MSFSWGDYHTLATTLVTQSTSLGSEDACLRSAISRAYYAAFVSARNLGRDRGYFVPTGRGTDHGLVRNYFRFHRDRRFRAIGANLDRLLQDRAKADYDDVVTGNLPAKAAQCLRSSGEVPAELRSI